jgi:hypothetical protein
MGRSSDSVVLFMHDDLRVYLLKHRQAALDEVERQPQNSILGIPPDDLAESIASRHLVQPVEFDDDGIYADHQETTISVKDLGERFFYSEDTVTVPATRVTFHVPFTGDPRLLLLQGSSISSMMPRAIVGDGVLTFEYERRAGDENAAQLKAEFEKSLHQTKGFATQNSNEAKRHNEQLVGAVKAAIEARREKLLKAQNMAANLGYPLKRRADAPTTYTVPQKRKPIVPVKTSPAAAQGVPAFKPEPTLDVAEYENILRIIEGMATVLERSPKPFAKMKEEDLRTHFLVQLNGQYEGNATGETFNMEGKTDILIRVENQNIFIGECKFWHGPQQFTETINQLLGYTSWRDTKTALVIFNRDAQTSGVVAQIPGLLAAHPNFKRAVPQDGETRFRAVLHQNGDTNREIIVTVLVFDVPK